MGIKQSPKILLNFQENLKCLISRQALVGDGTNAYIMTDSSPKIKGLIAIDIP
jgi:hypothetical protein